MLHPDFKNAENIDLHSAFAVFVIMMGFLFYIDASPGSHTLATQLTMLFGLLWYVGHKLYLNYLGRSH